MNITETHETEVLEPQALVHEPSKSTALKLVGVVAVVAVCLAAALFYLRVSPLLTVQRALGNFGGEVTTRLQTSPLHALELLGRNYANGTTNVHFRYADDWDMSVNGLLSIMTDSELNELFVGFDMSVADWGEQYDIDFEFLMNQYSAMVRSHMLNDNFYGITYATFRDDFAVFADVIGIPDDIVDVVADFIENLNESLNANDEEVLEDFQRYIDAVVAFVRSSDFTTTRVDGLTRAEFVYTADDIVEILQELLDLYENHADMRDAFDMFEDDFFDEFIEIMQEGLNEFAANLRGEITLVLYVGRGNRMNRIEVDIDMRYERERIQASFALDLGSDALDPWRFDVSVTDRGQVFEGYVVWEIRQYGDRYVNTILFHEPGMDSFTLMSDWNTSTGAFTLSYDDDFSHIGNNSINGVFSLDSSGGFTFAFDEFALDRGRSSLLIEIESLSFTNINFPASYINIRDWGERLIDDLERAIMELFW